MINAMDNKKIITDADKFNINNNMLQTLEKVWLNLNLTKMDLE